MYRILKFRDNVNVHISHPSFGTFDLNVELVSTGLVKWVSVPHELFFEYLQTANTSLHSYVENKNFFTWEDAILDLYELGYSFEEDMLKYLQVKYSKFIFETMANYNPDFINESGDYDYGIG